ncbi:MAG: hypothetical protein ABIK85_04350 [Candidatus Eisenbacteria bacterium]
MSWGVRSATLSRDPAPRASSAVSLVLLLAITAQASVLCPRSDFVASTVHEDGGPVYGLASGEFDPDHAGHEVAYLAADGSVFECIPGAPVP